MHDLDLYPVGQVQLSLLNGSHAESARYRRHSVHINSTFAFCSVSGTFLKHLGGGYIPTIRVQGQLYSRTLAHSGLALPSPSVVAAAAAGAPTAHRAASDGVALPISTGATAGARVPVFAEVYMLDPAAATSIRAERLGDMLSPAILTALSQEILADNPSAAAFHSLAKKHQEDVVQEGWHARGYTMRIHGDIVPAGVHSGTVNAQTGTGVGEVAAIVPGDVDGEAGTRDLLVRPRSDANPYRLQFFKSSSAAYLPMAYLATRPRADLGWSVALKAAMKLTPLQYICILSICAPGTRY